MKHIEASRKIELSKPVEMADLKTSLIARIEKIMEIESVSDGLSEFKVIGTTGTPSGLTRHARLNLDVSISQDNNVVRVLISGYAGVSRSLSLIYASFLFLLLLVGLLPGSFETSGAQSGALDMIIFMLFGGYIVMDTGKKLSEPQNFMDMALKSLDTEFG